MAAFAMAYQRSNLNEATPNSVRRLLLGCPLRRGQWALVLYVLKFYRFPKLKGYLSNQDGRA